MSEPRLDADALAVALRSFADADAFERDAAGLRAELRRLRATRRTAPSWERRWDTRPALPDALPRLAVEAAFLIAAAVFAGVAGFGALWIIATMGAAWLVVVGLERLVSRERAAAAPVVSAEPYEESLLDALRPSPSARSHSSSAQR